MADIWPIGKQSGRFSWNDFINIIHFWCIFYLSLLLRCLLWLTVVRRWWSCPSRTCRRTLSATRLRAGTCTLSLIASGTSWAFRCRAALSLFMWTASWRRGDWLMRGSAWTPAGARSSLLELRTGDLLMYASHSLCNYCAFAFFFFGDSKFFIYLYPLFLPLF